MSHSTQIPSAEEAAITIAEHDARMAACECPYCAIEAST